MRIKLRQLRDELELAANRHTRSKTKYQLAADNVDKCWQKVLTVRANSMLAANQKSHIMKVWNV